MLLFILYYSVLICNYVLQLREIVFIQICASLSVNVGFDKSVKFRRPFHASNSQTSLRIRNVCLINVHKSSDILLGMTPVSNCPDACCSLCHVYSPHVPLHKPCLHNDSLVFVWHP